MSLNPSDSQALNRQARTLIGAFAIGLGLLGGLLGSGVLCALAVCLALFFAGQPWIRGAPMLLGIIAGCTTLATRPVLQQLQPRPLGITARLAEGNPTALPSAVTTALTPESDLTVRYTEDVRQEDNEVPVVLVLVVSPVFLLGVPTGSYAVTATAELTVLRGSQEIARYQGEARASRLYGLYYGSTLRQLEDEAREQVRRVIDEALYRNADNLTAAARTP